MKQLIYKDLREMRLIPFAYAALLSTLLIVWNIMSSGQTGPRGISDKLTSGDTASMLIIACSLSGWLVGSHAIAYEVGDDTLQFLTLLPMGRLQIWRAKIIAGMIAIMASIMALFIGYFLTSTAIFGLPQVIEAYSSSMQPYKSSFLFILGGSLYTYSVALLVSTLVDRVLAATIISLLLEIAYLVIVISLAGSSAPLMIAMIVLMVIACLSASWVVFVRAGSLRTVRRFQLTSIVMAGCFGSGTVVGLIYMFFTYWYHPIKYWTSHLLGS